MTFAVLTDILQPNRGHQGAGLVIRQRSPKIFSCWSQFHNKSLPYKTYELERLPLAILLAILLVHMYITYPAGSLLYNMDGLSVIAVVAAVVGVADVAIRTSTSLIDLLSTIKEAPNRVEKLRNEIRDLGNTIVRIRTLVAESRGSTLNTQFLDDLRQALDGCQATLSQLQLALGQFLAGSRGSILVRAKWHASYPLSDQKIRGAYREVEGRKTTLLLLFAIMGSDDAVAMRSQLSEMRLDSETRHSSLQNVLENETAIIHRELSSMRLESQSNQGRIQDTVQRGALAINQTLTILYRRQFRFESHTKARLGRILDAVAAPKLSGITIESDIYDLVVNRGLDPELRLLPSLRALRDLISGSSLRGPLWRLLFEQLERLRESAFVLCAASADQRASLLHDAEPREGEDAAGSTKVPNRATSTQICHFIRASESGIVWSSTRKKEQWQHHRIRSKTGPFVLVLDLLHRNTQQGTEHTVFMKCAPTLEPGEMKFGISILFQVSHSRLRVDSVLRNIRPYSSSPSTSDVFTYAKQGNIPELDTLFRNGKTSVMDHDEEGYGLLVVRNPSLYIYIYIYSSLGT